MNKNEHISETKNTDCTFLPGVPVALADKYGVPNKIGKYFIEKQEYDLLKNAQDKNIINAIKSRCKNDIDLLISIIKAEKRLVPEDCVPKVYSNIPLNDKQYKIIEIFVNQYNELTNLGKIGLLMADDSILPKMRVNAEKIFKPIFEVIEDFADGFCQESCEEQQAPSM